MPGNASSDETHPILVAPSNGDASNKRGEIVPKTPNSVKAMFAEKRPEPLMNTDPH